MSQSDTVTNILERITQETAQVTTKKKIFGMKSKRTSKTPQKKVVLESSNSASSTSNSMSPATSPFRAQQSQLPARSKSMPVDGTCTLSQDSTVSQSSSANFSDISINRSNSASFSNDTFFNDQWEVISPCIDSIFEQGTGGKFEPAFQAVERLCRNKQYYENMNNQLLIKIDNFSKIICSKLHPPINFQSVISVLDFVQRSNALLGSIFSTFERSFLSPQLTIEQLVFRHITKAIHADQIIVNGICSTVVDQIGEQRKEATTNIIIQLNNGDNQKEKTNQSSSYQQTAHAVNQFDLTKDIIKPLETATINFYSNLTLKDDTPQHLLKHIQLIILNEEQIFNFFTPDIQKVIISTTRENVYEKRFNKEFPYIVKTLMDSKDTDSIILLTSLVSAASSKTLSKSFISSWSNDLKQRCEQILSISGQKETKSNDDDDNNNNNIIPEFIKINETMNACEDVIGIKLSSSIFRVFKSAINEATFKMAFLLASYSNALITSSPTEFIKQIDQIVSMFRYLDLMDAFFAHYREFLAARLLNGVSSIDSEVNQEALKGENLFLDKIEIICGDDDVAPMREMLNDAESWPKMNKEFQESLKTKENQNEKQAQESSSQVVGSDSSLNSNENESSTEKQENYANEPESQAAKSLNQENYENESEELASSPSIPVFFQIFNSAKFQQYQDYAVSESELSQKVKNDETDDKSFKFVHNQIPSEILATKSKFSSFYSRSFARKSLKWLPLFDRVTIKLNSATIDCSFLYYVFLNSIINGHPLKETEIDEKTLNELADVLVSNKIVTCDRKSGSNSIYECNFLIASNNEEKLIILQNPSLLRPKMMKDEKMDDIFAMRQTRIEAALVLAMKKLRIAKKEDLFDNMRNNVTFNVSDEDLEKCVDILVDKSYFSTNEEGYIVFKTE